MFSLTNSSTLSPHPFCVFRSKRRQKPPWPPSRTWWRSKTMTCLSVFTTADPPSRSSPLCRRHTSANPALPRGGQTSRRQSNSTSWWGEMCSLTWTDACGYDLRDFCMKIGINPFYWSLSVLVFCFCLMFSKTLPDFSRLIHIICLINTAKIWD